VSDHFDLTLPGARVTFSTRRGGVSRGPFESLNLGLWTDDEAERVFENRRRLEAHTGAGHTTLGRQVHGVELREWTAPPEDGDPPEVDGHITREPGLGLLVQVADCLPVALATRDQVAMLHCGWRGLAAGIVERGVGEVAATAAAVGPGIGPCHYEVGEEVLEAFAPLGDGIAEGRMLSLREVARRLLTQAGVEQVEVSELCTSCEPELFYSHRRDDGDTGRQAGLVWMDG
jgi:polyphenol oxidase